MLTNAEPEPDRATEWATRIGVALIFALTGLDKIAPISSTYWAQTFDAIGFGQWFRYFTCGVEIVGGLLFLVPRTTIVGAGLLIATMVGAMATHVFIFHHPGNALFPGAYLVGVILAFTKLRRAR